MTNEAARNHAMLVMGLALGRNRAQGIAWAQRIVATSKIRHVPALKLAIAEDAIQQWDVTHPPRKREPGDDDEPVEGESV
jgi:hypothetical protein